MVQSQLNNALINVNNGYIWHFNIDESISYNSIVDVNNNTDYGIFGVTDEKINRDLLKVGTIDDIKIGDAFIRTTDINNRINDYKIKILEIDKDNVSRNIYFQVTDKELLSMSGGIVQGMSGSPIIQNNMIVGAVTRVLVDDVSRGYGISIVTMLEEGDKVLEKD